MIRCCGSNRMGNFCPTCGKTLKEDDPLLSLLAHVRTQAGLQRALADRRAKSPTYHPDVISDRGKKYLRQMEKSALKWESWQTALDNLIEESGQFAVLKEGS